MTLVYITYATILVSFTVLHMKTFYNMMCTCVTNIFNFLYLILGI